MTAEDKSANSAGNMSRNDFYERQKYLFALAFLAVSVVPLLLMNYNASRHYQDSWVDNVSRELAISTVDRKEILDRFLLQQENHLVGLLALRATGLLKDDRYLVKFLKAIDAGEAIIDLGIYDRTGRLLAGSKGGGPNDGKASQGAKDWFTAALSKGRYVSDVVDKSNDSHFLTLAVADSERTGVVRAQINTGAFFDLIRTGSVGPEGDMFIINQRGELLTPSRLGRVGVTPDELALLKELAEKGGATKHDKEYIYCASYLKGVRWLLVTESNMETSLSSFHEARRLDTIRLAIATAVIVLAAIFLTYSMVGRLSRAERQRNILTSQVGEVEKMALIGRLAATVAHEINNPLQLISGQVGVMSDLLDIEEPDRLVYLGDYRKAIEKIRTQIGRAGTITRRLLGYSRATEGGFVDTDVNQAVEETVALFEHEAKRHRIVLVRQYRDGLPMVLNDPAQLQQVVLNVLHNAMDAIGQDGVIEISTRMTRDRVVVDFADTGPGLSREVMEHIYDPFFTTKPKGKGTGLGMYVSRDIMLHLGGELIASNRDCGGAIFSLRLPLSGVDYEKLAKLEFSY